MHLIFFNEPPEPVPVVLVNFKKKHTRYAPNMHIQEILHNEDQKSLKMISKKITFIAYILITFTRYFNLFDFLRFNRKST